MRFFTALIILFSDFASIAIAADTKQISPNGTFTITQHFEEEWTSKIHFSDSTRSEITLSDTWLWPALFHISPDDRWILQVQKSGSGENTSFLYQLDSKGRLLRTEPGFGELALAYLQDKTGVLKRNLYHTGIEFISWEMKRNAIRFMIRGSSVKKNEKGVRLELIYDLKKHRFRTL